MNQVVAEVISKQLGILRWFYLVFIGLLVTLIVLAFVLGSPLQLEQSATPSWIEWVFAGVTLLLLGVVLPVVRRILLDEKRVKHVDGKQLQSWGLPENIDPLIARQAVFLTRYTAGYVASWGLASAVGLYGLMIRLMGAADWLVGLFFLLAAGTLAILPLKRQQLIQKIENIKE